MSYRKSIAPGSGRRTQPSTITTHDVFPLLDYNEIVSCLHGCDIQATYEDVSQPKQQYIQTVINEMLNGTTGVHTTNMGPRLQSAASKAGVISDQNNYMDDQADARIIMANQRPIYQLMCDIGIFDFNIMDIAKPDAERTRRILSALINFTRFRASPTTQWYNVITAQEIKAQELDQMLVHRVELQNKVEQSKIEHAKSMEIKADIEKSNRDDHEMLNQLVKEAGTSSQDRLKYKNEKAEKTVKTQENARAIEEIHKRRDNLKKYVIVSKDQLLEINKQLENTLSADKQHIELLKRRIRGFEFSTKNFKVTHADVDGFIKIINECEDLKQKREEDGRKHTNGEEFRERNKREASELDHTVDQLNQRLKSVTVKLERAKQQNERKKKATVEKLKQYDDEISTQAVKNAKAEEKLGIIRNHTKQIEEQMNTLRGQTKSEFAMFQSESQKLKSIINAYLIDMTRKIQINT